MQNNDKKYFIPVDGTPIEVSEEIYRAYYQPIWNTRNPRPHGYIPFPGRPYRIQRLLG